MSVVLHVVLDKEQVMSTGLWICMWHISSGLRSHHLACLIPINGEACHDIQWPTIDPWGFPQQMLTCVHTSLNHLPATLQHTRSTPYISCTVGLIPSIHQPHTQLRTIKVKNVFCCPSPVSLLCVINHTIHYP